MEPLETECRYLAARCAALAGSRTGERWGQAECGRAGALAPAGARWLRADLAQWARTLDSGSELDRNLAKKMLTRWRVEPDLAGLLEPNASDELSADERKDYFALWHEVGVVLQRIARQERAFALDPKHEPTPRRITEPS